MNINEIYTVEYSVIQNCYHIDTLEKTLVSNLEAVEKEINNGFLIIGMFSGYDAASEFVSYHRNMVGKTNFYVDGTGTFIQL